MRQKPTKYEPRAALEREGRILKPESIGWIGDSFIPTVIAPCSGGGGKLTIALTSISIDFGTLAEDDGICSATKNVISFSGCYTP